MVSVSSAGDRLSLPGQMFVADTALAKNGLVITLGRKPPKNAFVLKIENRSQFVWWLTPHHPYLASS